MARGIHGTARPRPTSPALAAAVACLVAAAPGQAAADEGENALSVSLNYATYAVPDHNPPGAMLGFDYERGFTDTVWLRVSGGGSVFYSGEDGASYAGHAVIGLTYAFDVLRYVPYANLGVGAIVIGGGPTETDVSALLELGFGLDILHSRSFSYGVQVRFESFIEETAFFTAGLRATYRWGFF
jgi:hypothetical protein